MKRKSNRRSPKRKSNRTRRYADGRRKPNLSEILRASAALTLSLAALLHEVRELAKFIVSTLTHCG